MTNKKVTSIVKQSLSILQETINTFDILQEIENDAGTCLREHTLSMWEGGLEGLTNFSKKIS